MLKYTTADLEKAGIGEDELQIIKDGFKDKLSKYETAAQSVTGILLKTSGVHSVRYRVKDPDHLAEKIVRKRIENPDRVIDANNYDKEITDLAGVRVLHLFKEDWQKIHSSIMNTWSLTEKPIAYHREGDSKEVLKVFIDSDCDLREHPAGYRSVHYTIETALTRETVVVEIQVRTIFEEGWSEVDHKIRYPNFSNNPLTNNLLMILNRLASNADEISGFAQELHSYIIKSTEEENKKNDKIKELENIIKNPSISEEDKSTLKGVADLISKSITETPHSQNYNFNRTTNTSTNNNYEPLAEFLKTQLDDSINTFITEITSIEKMVNFKLPIEAYEQLDWWTKYSSHSRQWLLSGWGVNSIDTYTREVHFHRWSYYIDTRDAEKIDKWSKKLNVTKDKLLAIINNTAPLSTLVQDYVRNNNI